MPSYSGTIIDARLLREREGRQLLLARCEDDSRRIVRRVPVLEPPTVEARAQALEAIRNAAIPGLAPIVEVHVEPEWLEVHEALIDGFSVDAALEEVRQHITVNVALSMVHDAARSLAQLHALTEPDGRPAHLVHGRIGLNELVISRRGETFVVGVEGLQGDLLEDVEGLMTIMRSLLATRAVNPKGSALLDRLSDLKFASCGELARAIEVYLARQDPQALVERRRRFTSAVLHVFRDPLESPFADDEPTAGELDVEAQVLRGGGEAVAVGIKMPSFPERFDSIPSLDPRDVELLKEKTSASKAVGVVSVTSGGYEVVPDHLIEGGDTAETAAEMMPEGFLDDFGGATEPGPEEAGTEQGDGHDLEFGRRTSAPPPLPVDVSVDTEDGEADGDVIEEIEVAREGLLARAATPAPDPSIAESVQVGDYRVVASIGRGGMGEIYLGREVKDGRIGRLVALKVLGTQGNLLESEEQALDMLLDEAKIMAHISHPNVLKVIHFGKAHGRYFLATEYLEGRPLVRVMIEAYAKRNGMDYGVVAAIGADAAHGLHAAHSAVSSEGAPLQVVHRDVSPQNIFVTYAGITKVIDFGVAQATQRVAKTAVGLVKGKAAYMSPEQAEGRDVDARSDVFSLGVCLWEMTAGCRLFKRDNEYDTLLSVQNAPIEPPSVIRGDPNPVLDHIILNALARDRARRTQSARELAAQLEDYTRGVGITDRHEVVSGLLEEVFGEAKAKEQSLITALERRGATEAEVAQLEALSGVSQHGNFKEITLVGTPDGLAELDDFGAPSGVIRAVDEIQAERSSSMLDDAPPTESQSHPTYASVDSSTEPPDLPAPVSEDGTFDANPTRKISGALVDQVRKDLAPPPEAPPNLEFDATEPFDDGFDVDDEGFEIVEASGLVNAMPQTAELAPAPPTVAAEPPSKKTSWLVGALLGASFLALGIAGVLLWQMLPSEDEHGPTVPLRTVADDPVDPGAEVATATASPEGQAQAGVDDPPSVPEGQDPEAPGDADGPAEDPPPTEVAVGDPPADVPAVEDPGVGDPAPNGPAVEDPGVGDPPAVEAPVAEAPAVGDPPPDAPAVADPKVDELKPVAELTPTPVAPPPPKDVARPKPPPTEAQPVRDPGRPTEAARPTEAPRGSGRPTMDSMLAALKKAGLNVTRSERTYMVDDGRGGSVMVNANARIKRVEAGNAEGYLVTTKSAALTAVSWIGRVGGERWQTRGVSVNDCQARVTASRTGLALRYGADEVRVPPGGGILFDVAVPVPERADRLEVDPLGISLGAKRKGAAAVHCASGWWGKQVVLRRLPPGRYTLRWTGPGVTQTSTLVVEERGVQNGQLKRVRRPS